MRAVPCRSGSQALPWTPAVGRALQAISGGPHDEDISDRNGTRAAWQDDPSVGATRNSHDLVHEARAGDVDWEMRAAGIGVPCAGSAPLRKASATA